MFGGNGNGGVGVEGLGPLSPREGVTGAGSLALGLQSAKQLPLKNFSASFFIALVLPLKFSNLNLGSSRVQIKLSS